MRIMLMTAAAGLAMTAGAAGAASQWSSSSSNSSSNNGVVREHVVDTYCEDGYCDRYVSHRVYRDDRRGWRERLRRERYRDYDDD